MRRSWPVALLILGAALCYGADFWEEKKFTEWSEKDIERLITRSPWAREMECRSCGGFGGGGGGGGGRRGGGGGGGGSAPAPAAPLVVFRWFTARPMREALVKRRYGAEIPAEAQAQLARESGAYILGIAEMPGGMARSAPGMKETAVLIRKGKEPMKPIDVQAQVDQATGMATLLFVFEKKPDNLITVEDNEVEFSVKLRNSDFKAKFKLKDMVYNGKLEL